MNARTVFFTVLGTAAILAAITACTFAAMRHEGDPTRGRYLVEKVGMCIDCHSPRDQQGQFVAEKWLQGAVLPFAATVPMPWAPVSKPIAGLPGLTDAQALTFLTTGQLPGGRTALPPMPEFRFEEQDARDVVAYLRNPVLPEPVSAATAAGPQPTR